MRKIRELLRLKFEQRLSDRKIAVVLSMSRSALGECLPRAAIAGVVWPLPEGLDDAELERRLYPSKPRPTEIPWPDFAHVHRELSRPGVTRQLLWQEYKAQHPDGLQYSAFCDRYRQWLCSTVEPVMRFAHRAGEKCFVDGSRRSRFVELDQPALKSLPPRAYEYAQWKMARVHPDYHIELEHAYYSVPYRHIGERVEVRVSARMVEIFARRELIASHVRLNKRGARATLDAHRPANHRAVIDTTIERLLQRAQAIAPSVAQVLTEQFNRKRHPEEALRVAQGILRLAADFSPQQLAAACERALALKACSYRSVRALITTPQTDPGESRQLSLVHENVRGSDYFH